jgi:hypothetical protein
MHDPRTTIQSHGLSRQVWLQHPEALGRRLRRLEEERACNEKATDSKVKYLRASALIAFQLELVVPAAMVPSSDDYFEA